ncbi:hypothetical protein K7432_011184 [Basidiobolus ranarum]|uniref:Uncharacterized protein n=1 Tax=Basidiobolus ranarum TaxID=34480 RepID=A0ABR2WMQ7_9FUNG
MKPTKGRYRQRIQAICRGSNSYYSEDILISVLLCLVAGSKPLLLKTRSETIHGLSEMLEQMVQDVFGLNCATINCSQISSPGELYYILINRSREKKLRSQVTSIVRANSPTTSLKAPSGFMNTSRATQSSNPNAFVARELSKPLSPANRTERGFSADDRILGDDTNRSNSFRHSTPIERFSDYSHIDRYSRDQNIVTFGGTPERNNPAKPATLREYHQQLSNQHNDSELIPLQHLNERNENETFRQQKHSASLHVTSHAFNFSKKLANVIVLEGLDDINDTIQSALSEILSKGWFIDRNTMCHVPEPFVIIALATPNSAVRLSKHLLDRFYLNYTYDGTISAKSPPHSKRAFIFSYQVNSNFPFLYRHYSTIWSIFYIDLATLKGSKRYLATRKKRRHKS